MTLNATSPVHEVRARLLRSAYLNTVWPVKSWALATDIALAALDQHDPAAAAQLVADMAANAFPADQVIRDRAQAADVPDRDTWAGRAELLRDFTRFPYDVDRRDATGEAQRLWAGLREYLPQVAAALALFLTQLPEGWMHDLFAAETVEQIRHSGPMDTYRPPEVAPFEDGEDCPACGDVQDMCRLHVGFERGVAHARAMLATAATDTIARQELTERQQHLAANPAPAGQDNAAADPTAALLAVLGTDAQAWEQLDARHYWLANRESLAAHYRSLGHDELADQTLAGQAWP